MTKRVAIFSFVDRLNFSAFLSVARGFDWSLNFDSETKTTLFWYCASYFSTLFILKQLLTQLKNGKKWQLLPLSWWERTKIQQNFHVKFFPLKEQSSSLKCHTSPPKTRGGAGERDVLIPSVKMPFGDVTYFCEHGRYFSIGFYLSEIQNLLLAVATLQTFYLSVNSTCWQFTSGNLIFWSVTDFS